VSSIVGLDIGGANLKAAQTSGIARSVPFELWRRPADLPGALRQLLATLPAADTVAVTMTGELCDCFANKSEGVRFILGAAREAAGAVPLLVWTTAGRFVTFEEAIASPLAAAAANWLALATIAGRMVPDDAALLVDIGSTTTDLIPLHKGVPAPRGLTDPARLQSGELFYRGVERTPVCAVLGKAGAAELFATLLDVHLLLGLIADDETNCRTADGRPATSEFARARLARMVCEDPDSFSMASACQLAQHILEVEKNDLRQAVTTVAAGLQAPITAVVLAGAGEFLARQTLDEWHKVICKNGLRIVSLAEQISGAVSEAACAHAVANLASQ
jgi:(4-(4-[2-(gamma-L-glutamylamino)ethyl]phenoxymethyl)furan-2-yl)methanamine synthase